MTIGCPLAVRDLLTAMDSDMHHEYATITLSACFLDLPSFHES